VIGHADIRRVQEWMGHADVQTTMRYLHYAPRPEDGAWSPRPSRSTTPGELRLDAQPARAPAGGIEGIRSQASRMSVSQASMSLR
jgi:hypothetical protein